MSTHLEIVNRVLRRLREDEVASIDESAYSQLIGEFVADIHQEVGETWLWPTTLRNINIATIADDAGYLLHATTADGGDIIVGGSVATSRSVPRLRSSGAIDVMIADDVTGINTGLGKKVVLLSDEDRHIQATGGGDVTVEYPTHCSIRKDSVGRWSFQLWPKPSVSDKYVRMGFFVPETNLEVDGTTDDNEIYIPERPIYLGALWLALNERGEEIGEPGGMAEHRYRTSLIAAQEEIMSYEFGTGRFDWFKN